MASTHTAHSKIQHITENQLHKQVPFLIQEVFSFLKDAYVCSNLGASSKFKTVSDESRTCLGGDTELSSV